MLGGVSRDPDPREGRIRDALVSGELPVSLKRDGVSLHVQAIVVDQQIVRGLPPQQTDRTPSFRGPWGSPTSCKCWGIGWGRSPSRSRLAGNPKSLHVGPP